MKLPVFEEVKTSDFSVTALLKLFHRHGAGKCPLYIHLNANDSTTANEQADHILRALKELGVHPKLPFPCYVISPHLMNHPELPHTSEEKFLPSHFYKKAKRLKNKEQSLLNRVRIVADKLTNQDILEINNAVENEMSEHKRLHKLTKETHFLEQLLKGLNN